MIIFKFRGMNFLLAFAKSNAILMTILGKFGFGPSGGLKVHGIWYIILVANIHGGAPFITYMSLHEYTKGALI